MKINFDISPGFTVVRDRAHLAELLGGYPIARTCTECGRYNCICDQPEPPEPEYRRDSEWDWWNQD